MYADFQLKWCKLGELPVMMERLLRTMDLQRKM